jgi:chorismate synthase
MPTNCLGEVFTVNLFGESHGRCVGALVSGCPSNLKLSVEELQREMDRRKPGQSSVTTTRKEEDIVYVQTGLFEGKTTGMPILLVVNNKDADSSKYEPLKTIIRPGHADLAYRAKYGLHDYRGGGFSSGRLTAGIVAAGAVAKQVLKEKGIYIRGYTKAIGNIESEAFDWEEIERNVVRCPDAKKAEEMKKLIEQVQSEGDSIGGLVEVIAYHVPAGLGSPRFDSLKGALDKAFYSSGAVTAVEYGTGVKARYMRGSEFNDLPYFNLHASNIPFHSNNSGGIQGGISNGNDLIARLTIRPTPSIYKAQKTIDTERNPAELVLQGRHDPCLCPRIVPVIEAEMALGLADQMIKAGYIK